jgi:hypothetical protein
MMLLPRGGHKRSIRLPAPLASWGLLLSDRGALAPLQRERAVRRSR